MSQGTSPAYRFQYSTISLLIQVSQARTDQSLVRLNESISLLERQMEEGRKAIEKVLHAEITSRYKITSCSVCLTL